MALKSSVNEAFVSIFLQVKRRANLRESTCGIVVTQAEIGFDLQLLNAACGTARGLTIVEYVMAVPHTEVARRAEKLAASVEVSALDVPIFRERARTTGDQRREFVYVDSDSLEPVMVDGEPIAVGYNPTIC